MHQEPVRIKLVVVGDGSVGKTCILISYVKNEFPKEYTPTVFDNLTTTIKVSGQLINLGLWDTAGQEEYSSLRQLAYPNSDVFLICFSVIEPSSFINARKKWFIELDQLVPEAEKIFVGNKIDLRDQNKMRNANPKEAPITRENARKIIESETKCKYFECSALTQEGLKEVFQEASRQILSKRGISNADRNSKKVQQESSFCNLI